jgi:uncharacterized protein involved in cysteine biosynthesis
MPIPGSVPGRLAAGLGLPFRGLGYLVERPALWKYALLPLLLTFAGLATGLAVAAPLSGAILGSLWGESTGLLAIAWWLTRAAVYLVLVYLAAVALPVAISAPFADRLSARVEALEIGAAGEGGLARAAAEAWLGVAHAMVRLVVLLLGHAILLPSLMLPFVYPALAFAWTARWTAVEYLDLPMARNLHRLREVRSALAAVRPLGAGFGAVLAALFLLPFANLLIVPIGAVAGTLLYCDLIRGGHIERTRIAPPASGSATVSDSIGRVRQSP